MPKNVETGEDGLPRTIVGEWTREKHERLVKYVDITRAVRRKWRSWGRETTYIELFCGPGQSRIKRTRRPIEGSPIRTTRTAKQGGVPYTSVYLADFDETFVDAVIKRMPKDAGKVHPYVGRAETTVDQIVKDLDPKGLHFAFLDPYKLDPLPFSIIEKLAKLKRMDMLIHVSIQDFQRNLRRYMRQEGGPLDRFAPGWRKVVNRSDSERNIRIAIFKHWLGLIRKLDMDHSKGSEIEKVVGRKRQPLYWLVLVARHRLPHKFWNEIRSVSDQGELF
jgi:three-Cys-motif partner protein